MKHYAPHPTATRTPPLQLPPFHAVRTRQRSDGWTPERQAQFIGHLAQTRSVSAAARKVSMARETAYRLREKPGAEGFAAVWDMALANRRTPKGLARYFAARDSARAALRPSRKVTTGDLRWRYETGKFCIVFYKGRFKGVHQIPDNDALLALLARLSPRASEWEAMPDA